MKIGILGGGQLAKMLALAGIPLGYQFIFYDPAADCCAASLGKHIQAAYDDWQQLQHFAEAVDMVTYEFENVPLSAVNFVARLTPLYPKANALENTQDRWLEKQFFARLGIPTAQTVDIKSRADLSKAAEALDFPLILKSRLGGYDGKGQIMISSEAQLDQAWLEIAEQPFIAEQFIHYDREVSVIAARQSSGEIVFYDLAENSHRHGILQCSLNRPDDPFLPQAQAHIQRLMDALDYCGVLALEMFQVGDQLIANEYAPRVHNSGHWTIEGAAVSQFENHLRAILNLPLGATTHLAYCAMINFIGLLPDRIDLLQLPDSHYHDYGKQAKPGRKLGHLTLRADQPETVESLAQPVVTHLSPQFDPL